MWEYANKDLDCPAVGKKVCFVFASVKVEDERGMENCRENLLWCKEANTCPHEDCEWNRRNRRDFPNAKAELFDLFPLN